MSEEILVRHCSPTLAGLKTASLFTCPCANRERVEQGVAAMNQRLCSRGVRLVILRFSEKNALIYLYRPRKLTADMANCQAAELLQQRGYDPTSCDACVARLMGRLADSGEFPHEIGLFLGYPPEDVRGFLEQGADACKCSGCWKVYGDAEAAQKKFALYKKCTRVYREKYAKGIDIERLTVAG